jgi:hypothetical protein
MGGVAPGYYSGVTLVVARGEASASNAASIMAYVSSVRKRMKRQKKK